MEHAKIVQKVRDILNEHGGDDGLNIGTDRVLLEDYIESAIPDAVIMLAQKGYRVNVAQMTGEGEVELGDDFVSLIAVTSQEWNCAVDKTVPEGSPQEKMARNPYSTPGKNSPVCIMCERGSNKKLVALPIAEVEVVYNRRYEGQRLRLRRDELIRVKTEDGVRFYAKIDGDMFNVLNAGDKEVAAVCYMAAALVMGMFGEDNAKQRLSDISTNILQ